jgi:hypothetical protein
MPAGEDIGDESNDDDTWQRIGRGMRSSELLLRDNNTSLETQSAQQRVISELTDLIESFGPQQGGGDAATPRQQAGGSEAGTSPSDDPGTGSSPPAGEQLPKEKPARSEQKAVDDMLIEIWGQLPKQLQQQIQSPVSEQFLPEYERLIIEYYKRLAELDQR